ncbi:MAG: serine/threonine-protein kinase [Planctomycetota bacterium]|nr:serine/threonine-protein kinase [Planctomycetota bacterium]
MSDPDERLALLLERLASDSLNGRQPDLEAVVRENADLERELRELWATMILAEDFASFSGLVSENAGQPAQTSDRRSLSSRGSVPLPEPFDDYEPIAELGRGGMGVVYRARQSSLDRHVALKMILRGSLASPEDVARFQAEAEAAARLNHPNIVQVYDVGEHLGQPYFSMQYVEGTTLAQRLADGPLPSREAVRLLVPVCRGVAEAHRNGVLHRDLKPSNILIDDDERPFVTDFGLAKRIPPSGQPGTRDRATTSVETLTNSGAIIGTPSYMAPEQAAGQRGQIGEASDVYSLGAILYAMLTGRPPFQAASPLDTVLMVLEQDPVPPRVLNPKADADLEMIAMKCLQKPTDLRYRGADSLADDLDAWLNHEPISARSSQFTDILSRAFRETHHAAVLENWGILWMLHSAVVLVLCLITNILQWRDAASGTSSRWPYMGLWCVGLGIWAVIFYNLRRRAGPVTFVERQIVHVWAGSMIVSTLLYFVEWQLNLPVLTLSPVIGLVSGMVFLVKASLLNGRFYFQAVALFATGATMAVIPQTNLPDFSISLYGVVAGLSFFVPGLKYYRQRIAR